ncbi:MAG: hypothetical protein EXR21_02260 [Flavobacteriaceae bacterium]|nr:hypothetical protein [Flavobacteriaceae bacterium]
MKRTFLLLPIILFSMASQNLTAQTAADGLRQLDAMQYGNAKNTFANLQTEEPNNVDYFYYLGEISRLIDDPAAAKAQFEAGLTKNPNNALCMIGLGKLELDNKNLEAAKVHFNKALELTKTKNAQVLLFVGQSLISADVKDLDMAEPLLKKASELDKKNPEVFLALGDLYSERNDAQLPIKNYEEALRINDKYAKAYMKKGLLFARARTQEAYQTAVETTQKGIEVDPDYAPLYAQMAEIYSLSKRYEKAKENYVKYLSMVNNDLYARVRYASFLYLSKDFAKCVEEINAIQVVDSSRIFLYRLLGCSYYETGDYPNALKNLDQFFEKQKDPKKIIADDYRYNAMTLSKSGKDSLAAETYKKLINMDPSKSDYWVEVGNIYIKMKKYREAIQAFKAHSAIKENVNDYFSIGKAYYNMTKQDSTCHDSAIAAFKKVTEMKAEWPVGYYWLANATFSKEAKKNLKDVSGDVKDIYEKFIGMAKADSVKYKRELVPSFNYLGNYYYEKKKLPEATAACKSLLALDPENKNGLSLKKALKF